MSASGSFNDHSGKYYYITGNKSSHFEDALCSTSDEWTLKTNNHDCCGLVLFFLFCFFPVDILHSPSVVVWEFMFMWLYEKNLYISTVTENKGTEASSFVLSWLSLRKKHQDDIIFGLISDDMNKWTNCVHGHVSSEVWNDGLKGPFGTSTAICWCIME